MVIGEENSLGGRQLRCESAQPCTLGMSDGVGGGASASVLQIPEHWEGEAQASCASGAASVGSSAMCTCAMHLVRLWYLHNVCGVMQEQL